MNTKWKLGLTRQQWVLILWTVLATGTPTSAIIMKRLDITPNDWDDWVTLFSGVVTIVSGTKVVGSGSLASAAAYAKEMSPADQQVVAAGMDERTKIHAVENIPEVAVIAVHPINGLAAIAEDPAHPKVVPVAAAITKEAADD